MSSVSNSCENPATQNIRSFVGDCAISLVATTASVIPAFPFLMIKSAQQIGAPLPKMGTAFLEGCKAAPTLGAILATQMIVQKIIEKGLTNFSNSPQDSGIGQMAVSSMLVGAASAPALAAFNAKTMKMGVIESVRSLTLKQMAAISARETSFLAGVRISGPFNEYMKEKYGNTILVNYLSLFMSGAAASAFGHPFDTILSLSQKGIKIEKYAQLTRGIYMKAIGVGIFAIFYKTLNDQIQERR